MEFSVLKSFNMKICFSHCLVFVVIFCGIYHADSQNIDPNNGTEYFNLNEGNKTGGCDKNFTKGSGGFQLSLHNATGTCYFDITPKNVTDSKIVVFVHEIFLDNNDYLTFYKNCEDAKSNTSILFEGQEFHAESDSLTFVTEEPTLCMKLELSSVIYQRIFEGYYINSPEPKIPINDKGIKSIKSPIFEKTVTLDPFNYHYVYSVNSHFTAPAFIFEEFHLTTSSMTITGSTLPQETYTQDAPPDFFAKSTVDIELKWKLNTNDSFRLKIETVNPACSNFYTLNKDNPKQHVFSPALALDNGTVEHECRWVFYTKSDILGLALDKVEFASVLDIVAVNNGPSEISTPLLQLTSSNWNKTSSKIIRTTGNYMWIAYKPLTLASNFSANVSIHGQGGYHKGSGIIDMIPTVGNDTVFLLEVDQNEVVLLNFNITEFMRPATLSIYEDFASTNLLTTLHGNVWYPIMSRTSKMMIVATGFNAGKFTASFKGVPRGGCIHMSTLDTDSYILSGNCKSTCTWIIPPQDTLYSRDFLLHLQYISLEKDDEIEIIRLDSAKTVLGLVSSKNSHVPQLSVPADVGAVVNVKRGSCKKESDTVLVGHISYVPACSSNFTAKAPESLQLASPNYPDTYPLLTSCHWNIDVPKDSQIHLAFSKLKLAQNHCLNVTAGNRTWSFAGSNMPEDVLVTGNAEMKFDSSNCGHVAVNETLTSDEGFVLDATVADCGAVLNSKSGQINIADTKGKNMCVYKISVPAIESDKSVNIIIFNVTHNDDKSNLSVYNGASVREPMIANLTSQTWSRTNDLIVTYKSLNDASKGFSLSYTTMSCNKSMQCLSGICMHPDWRCNGKDECGDATDEINCGSVPLPPQVKETGYSSTTFGLSIVGFFVLGVVLAVVGPYVYQRYVRGQYRRFGDISVIE